MVHDFYENNPLFIIGITLIGFAVIISILQLLAAIRVHINAKTVAKQKELEWMMSPENPANQRIEPLYLRIEGTKRLLDLANDMIAEEIAATIFSYQAINKEYPVQRIDDDIKKVTETVLNGLKTTNLLDSGIVITAEFLAASITKISTQVLIDQVRAYNSNIRLSNMQTDPEQ